MSTGTDTNGRARGVLVAFEVRRGRGGGPVRAGGCRAGSIPYLHPPLGAGRADQELPDQQLINLSYAASCISRASESATWVVRSRGATAANPRRGRVSPDPLPCPAGVPVGNQR